MKRTSLTLSIMKKTFLTLFILFVFGCTVYGVPNKSHWSDQYYKLKGSSITKVLNKIGVPTEKIELEDSQAYIFQSIKENYVGMSSVCELKMIVSKGIVEKVEV